MKRSVLLAAITVAVLTGGWIFRKVPAYPADALHRASRHDTGFSVRRDAAPAADAARRAALELISDGWTQTPVSAGTFHLLTRENDVIALVAEDLPSGGSRITTLHRRRALR